MLESHLIDATLVGTDLTVLRAQRGPQARQCNIVLGPRKTMRVIRLRFRRNRRLDGVRDARTCPAVVIPTNTRSAA